MGESNRSVMAFNLSYLFDRTDVLELAMADLVGWLQSGAINPPGVTTYPLAKVADAHRAIESAQTTGKLVLIP
jgi:NADPH:quinone reductase-like Zn-dependent oxidoreductase